MEIKTTRQIIMLKSEHLDDKWIKVEDLKEIEKEICLRIENYNQLNFKFKNFKFKDNLKLSVKTSFDKILRS